MDVSQYLVTPGSELDLSEHDPQAKTGFEGGKRDGKRALPELNRRLTGLQERLWAESRQSLLVVLQAIDTGGKDGTIRHVFRGVNPQGVHVHGFGVPSEWETRHDFLWRIHKRTPENGAITIFNRSHYEDVLVVRVKGLVPEEQWSKRYRHIREFERMLSDEGTTIVKLFLHISKDEQRQRLQARLDEPDKHWKFSRGDLVDRELWDVYREAFEAAISETSTSHAPWYVVPANRKWYRNLVVSTILIETLETMSPTYPEAETGLDEIVIT
ncbi:MAG: polyphosphate kinase 2 family protein [Acidimicrobiia bacterium]